MTTFDRFKLALPLADRFIRFQLRLIAIDKATPKVPDNTLHAPEDAVRFDKEVKNYEEKLAELEREKADIKVLLNKMEEWADDDEPRSLSQLLSGVGQEPPIRVVVTIGGIDYRVSDDDEQLVYIAC